MQRLPLLLLALAILACTPAERRVRPGSAPASAARTATEAKKLIEFGWDEPNTSFLRERLAEMERTPFDGCVFRVEYPGPGGAVGRFTWECWSTRAFTEADLASSLADLRALRPSRFTHNFLRFNTTPGNVDWFDDFGAIIANAELAARLAREGRCAGILFDVEQYEGQLFDYRKQRDAAAKPWEAYAAQARRRGREVMQAFQRGFPDLTILLTFGHTLPWKQSGGDAAKLPEAEYGLLAPFLDGMVDAAEGGTRLVDGYELSYGFREASRFQEARRQMRSDVLAIVADKAKYAQVVRCGFGLWLDYDWRANGWNESDTSANYFTPEAFERSLGAALRHTDQFVWIYTEQPRWWTPEGGPAKLPAAYEAAIRAATSHGRLAPPTTTRATARKDDGEARTAHRAPPQPYLAPGVGMVGS